MKLIILGQPRSGKSTKLFTDYCEYSKKWASENPNILVDTSDYLVGIKKAKERLLKCRENDEIGER